MVDLAQQPSSPACSLLLLLLLKLVGSRRQQQNRQQLRCVTAIPSRWVEELSGDRTIRECVVLQGLWGQAITLPQAVPVRHKTATTQQIFCTGTP